MQDTVREMDSTTGGTRPAPDEATGLSAEALGEAFSDLGTRVGAELGAELGKELRESALLLGLALVVVGLVAALASTALLLG